MKLNLKEIIITVCVAFILAYILVVLMNCNGNDDTLTNYYSDWETCIVKEISDGIVVIECDGVRRNTAYVDGVQVGDLVQARTDYETYTEIE